MKKLQVVPAILLIAVFVISLGLSIVLADSQGPNFASSSSGWTNPENATSTNDNNCASTTTTNDVITLSDFNLSVPSGASVSGITVDAKVGRNNSGPRYFEYKLQKPDNSESEKRTVTGGDGVPKTSNCSETAFVSAGGESDLWGFGSVSSDDVNSPNFRVRLDGLTSATAIRLLDAVKITVHYVAPTPTPTPTPTSTPTPTPTSTPTPTPTPSSSSGSSGSSSSGSSSSCNDSKPSSAPKLIRTEAGINSVSLVWSEAADPVSYYLVAYGLLSNSPAYGNPNIGGKGTTAYTVNGLAAGVTYYFKIRAGNGCMPGDFSNELSVTPFGTETESNVADNFTEGVLGVESGRIEVSSSGKISSIVNKTLASSNQAIKSSPSSKHEIWNFILSVFSPVWNFITKIKFF